MRDFRPIRSTIAIGDKGGSLQSEGIGRLVGHGRDETGLLVQIDLGEAEWCPTALADVASTTALFNLGIATIFDPYDDRQKYLKLRIGGNFVHIPLVELPLSSLPAFEFLVGEEQVDHAVACLSSMTALKVSTRGAASDIMDFHRGLGGHAHEEQCRIDAYHLGIKLTGKWKMCEACKEMTMMDSTGPFPLPFVFTEGHRYIHVFIDVRSLHMRMMTSISKRETHYALERYSQLLPKGITMKGGIVRFDGAGENRAGALRMVEKLGCTPEFIAPHKSQYLGLLEKRLADCKHKGKTMLIDAGLQFGKGRRLLGEATRHAMCLKNDSVSRQLKAREGGRDGLTPRMVYEGENYKFHVTYNFPFGVVCVCHTKIEHATLTKGNGVPALYMGMAEFHPEGTARFYNPVSNFGEDYFYK